MGRSPQPQIRDRILDACTDHALAHGLPDRLEPLARAAATSPRMLIYHFGTRDALLRAILEHARRRQRQTLGELLDVRPDERYDATLLRAWRAMTGPEVRPFFRMFGPLPPEQERHLWSGFREEATTEWLAPLERGLLTLGRPELATTLLAVVRGLLMDLDATGDRARVDEAMRSFLELLGPLDQVAGPGGLQEPEHPTRPGRSEAPARHRAAPPRPGAPAATDTSDSDVQVSCRRSSSTSPAPHAPGRAVEAAAPRD